MCQGGYALYCKLYNTILFANQTYICQRRDALYCKLYDKQIIICYRFCKKQTNNFLTQEGFSSSNGLQYHFDANPANVPYRQRKKHKPCQLQHPMVLDTRLNMPTLYYPKTLYCSIASSSRALADIFNS